MTYSDLLVRLLQLDAKQLKRTVTFYDSNDDVYLPVGEFIYSTDTVTNQPYLSF